MELNALRLAAQVHGCLAGFGVLGNIIQRLLSNTVQGDLYVRWESTLSLYDQ
jgi:hypothetical protein